MMTKVFLVFPMMLLWATLVGLAQGASFEIILSNDTEAASGISNDTSVVPNNNNAFSGDDDFAVTEAPTPELEYWQVYGDDYYDYYYTDEALFVIKWLPKPFALLSMFCSYVVIREVFSEDRRGGRVGGTPINRMLMGMAIADIIYSLAYFLGTWAAPPEGAYGVQGNGTVGTCTFQGFLDQFGLMASVFSSTFLSIYYMLVVVRGWKDRDLQRVELWIHGGIWIVALAMGLYPIPLELYNSNGGVCWLDTSPPDCWDEWCIRGSNPWPHQLAATIIPFSCLFVSLVNMGIIIWKVRGIENTARKYAGSSITRSTASVGTPPSERSGKSSSFFFRSFRRSTTTVNRQKSTAVAKQAIYYTLAFLTTFVLDLIGTIRYYGFGKWNDTFDYFAYSVFLPSAGTLNFLVFSRIRTMKTPEGRFLRSAFFCLCCQKPINDLKARFRQPKQEAKPAKAPIMASAGTTEMSADASSKLYHSSGPTSAAAFKAVETPEHASSGHASTSENVPAAGAVTWSIEEHSEAEEDTEGALQENGDVKSLAHETGLDVEAPDNPHPTECLVPESPVGEEALAASENEDKEMGPLSATEGGGEAPPLVGKALEPPSVEKDADPAPKMNVMTKDEMEYIA